MAITEVRSETDVKTIQANFAELDARNDGITATAYVACILPNGKIAVSSVCTIN